MSYQQATVAVRGGLNDEEQYRSVVAPIYMSSTYRFIEFDQPGSHDYSRRGNPTRDSVQLTLAKLEGGVGAVVTNSGTAAVHLLCTMLLKPGDTLIAPKDCYGGSYRLFDSLSRRGMFNVCFIDQHDPQVLEQALQQRPAVVWIETPSNPLLNVVDIATIAVAAHQVGALVVVDNTFLSPILQRPFELGADFVLHSCTKYLNGHSDIVAGAVIANTPEWVTELLWWANNIGVTSGAFDSYLLLRGLRTLPTRILQQQRNAQSIVDYLQTQPLVKKVYYPGLSSHSGHALACKQQKGFGAMLSFEFAGDQVTLQRFLSGLTMFTLAESLGGVESLISHAATMTHAGMSAEARKFAGISDSLLRISVGLEESSDLIADLVQAFNYVAQQGEGNE